MIAFAYYLLKVIICSGVLFLYYHIALRNKLFHQWNRFYLLISVFISLVAPVVQVNIMHQVSDDPNKAIRLLQVFQSADGYLEEVTVSSHRGMSSDQWLVLLYAAISILFLFSVLLSLRKIFAIIRSHTIQWIEKIRFINTDAQGTPFSFFNYILWNKEIDLQTETGKQIFQHELVHVKEKHTLDKLFIQSILIVFWCNPFFWLVRRELQLIHEFIADKKSVGEHGTAALAAMILSSSYPSQFNSLTNQFFQTSIKRRLAMLTKIQNVKINYISRVLALPILAITILAFTLRTKTANISSLRLETQITVVIDAGHGVDNGKTSGAVVNSVSEDAIVLAIANKIKELNKDEKLKIVLTRTSDQIIDLHKRVDIAKENHADLFVSLHLNAAPDQYKDSAGMNGMEVMVSNKSTVYQKESELLGSVLQQQLNTIYSVKPALVKRKVGVWVLDQNICPSVLIECGYLTDEKDRAFITKDNNQTAIAEKILEAIERYSSNQQAIQKNDSDTIPKKQQSNQIKQDDSGTQGNINPINMKVKSKKPPLYILDGKEKKESEIRDMGIDPITIESINVLKDKSALDKYGNKGKNGVVEIRLKSQKQPLYFVDGKETGKEEVDKIDPNTIESINVLKGVSAADKYGKKGTDGVVEIKLKEQRSEKGANYQENDTIPKKEPSFTKVEIEAAINRQEWTEHLQKSLQSYIEQARAKGMEPGKYTVNVKFLVLKDGSVTDVKAINNPGYNLADGAVKTVQTGPKWMPGLQNGKKVNSYHTQPITFVIQGQ